MGKKQKGKAERYLAMPYHILNLTDIGAGEKILLAYIHGFGAKGCWSSNKTLGEALHFSPRKITRMIAEIRKYTLKGIKK